MPDFFERLQRATRLYGERPPEFLSTHPVTANRIAETITRAEQVGHKGSRDSLDFQLIKARLDIFKSHNLTQKVSQYKALVKADKDSAAAHYGLALALDKVSQHTQAIPNPANATSEEPRSYSVPHYTRPVTVKTANNLNPPCNCCPIRSNSTRAISPFLHTTHAHFYKISKRSKPGNVLLDILQKPAAQQPGMYTLLARAASDSGL